MRVRLVNEDGSSCGFVTAFGAIDYTFHGDCDDDGLPIYR